MSKDDPRAKLLKLLDVLRELDEKRAAVYVEMDALLGGGEGIGSKVTRLKAYYSACWQERYRTPYTFTNHAMVGASLKRFLVAHDANDVGARMMAYIKSDEPFYTRARHPFEIFVKSFNSFVSAPVAGVLEDSTAKLEAARGE